MDQPRQSRAPLLVAIVLLLLPVLYVGSYLALVRPHGYRFTLLPTGSKTDYYRAFNPYAEVFFWPLEQMDRQVRRDAWR